MTAIKTPAITKKATPAKKIAKSVKKAIPSKKEGLREAQARILRVLAKAKGPMNRGKINEACAKGGFATAEKFVQWMADPLGSPNAEIRNAQKARCGYASLIELKMVTFSEVYPHGKEHASEWVYSITASGRKALEDFTLAQKAKAKAAK